MDAHAAPPHPIRAITAFCSSCEVDPVFFRAAEDFGRAIAENGWTLVYGGNDTGPMGAMARGARSARGRVIGVSPKLFGDLMDNACDEFHVTETMRERKAKMESLGDAFVTLPGGLGTLEEFFEIVVGRHLRTHGKPLVLLNIAGFYDPLIEMIRRGIDSGFIRPPAWEPVHIAADVHGAIDFLRHGGRSKVQPAKIQ